jgi:O-antigen ligase
MFEDKKIIGHGVNSFRYLCNLNPYSVEEDIKRDHAVLSPFAGLLVYNIISESKFYLTVTSLEGEKFGGIFKRNNYLNFYSPSGFYINKNQPLFSSYEYINGCNTHPHNIYLQFLAELGITGFLLFSVIFIYICLQLLKYSYKRINEQITYKEKCLSFILFGTFMALFPLLPSGNFFNNWLMIITFLPVGFYISIFSKKNG